jgi:hypothetical protein
MDDILSRLGPLKRRLFERADLPLEPAILLIAGMTMLIAGVLLFPVSAGLIPYYENGLYGLLLFMFALQTVTLGKTPFGDVRRSKPLLAAGVGIAALGIITCFVPDLFGRVPRMLLFLCFGPGGLLLLAQMLLAKDKFRLWMRLGGIFRRLAAGCAAVYLLSALIGLLLWKRDLLTTPMTALVVLAYGAAIVFLAGVLRKVYRAYPEAERKAAGDAALSDDRAMLLLTGVFMVLLGVLLIPVNLGLIPFSGGAQLGLLMVINAIQMLASGDTPIGPFPRTWLMVALGLLFAAAGIVSCVVPGVLVPALTVLIGALNIAGGLATLWRTCVPLVKRIGKPRSPVHPVLVRLNLVQLTMGLLSVLFGASMFVSGMIPGHVIGVILAANGLVLLYLMRLLFLLDGMRDASETPA